MLKRFPLIVLSCLCLTQWADAQYKEKMDFHLRSFIAKAEDPSLTVDLFIHGEKDAVGAAVLEQGGWVKNSLPFLVNARVPVGRIEQLARSTAIHHFEFSLDRGELMNDSMRVKNRVDWVHQGRAPLGQGYDGSGVVMGFIDSGLDIMHPDLRTADDQSRVYRYWDQVPGPNASSPAPYGYGREWTQEQLNSGGPIPVEPANLYGHGTTVVGTGAGNGLANGRHKGVAPEADIIIVATNFGLPNWRASVADAVDYIIREAEAAGKPAVINASLGSYLGSHDGKDAAALFIEQLINAQGGRVMVSAAGNYNYQDPYHMQTQVGADTTFSWFNYITPSALGYGAVLFELWADAADFDEVRFAVGCDQSIPRWELRGHTPFRTVDQVIGQVVVDTLWSPAGNNMAVVQYYAVERGEQIQMQVVLEEPDSAQLYYRFMTTGSGKFDVWSHPIFGTSRMITNLPPIAELPALANYVLPDRNKHMVDSWACLPNVITVANYCNEVSYIDYNGDPAMIDNSTEGDISPNSSAGPTRDERMKPNIASTGDITFTAAPLIDIQNLINFWNGYKVDPGGMHVRNGGTSIASPVVAGTAALYLQRCPTATAQEIMAAMQRNARTDQFTGTVPNNYWGMGKLDSYNTLLNNAGLDATTTEICEGQFAEVSAPEGFSVLEWNDGSVAEPLEVSAPGEVSALLTSDAGCVAYSDTLAFQVIPSPPVPVITVQGNTLTSSVGPAYQWYLDGDPLEGEVGQVLEATMSGTYTVEFIGLNGCATSSEGVDVIILGLNENSAGSIAVWPIPAQDQLRVRIPEEVAGAAIVTIFSSDGKTVVQERHVSGANFTIPLNGLAAGLYNLQVQVGQERWSRRFVKLP